jgi:MYXO-CTERM domain-containing protein
MPRRAPPSFLAHRFAFRFTFTAAALVASLVACSSEARATPSLVTALGSSTETAEVQAFEATSSRIVYYAYVHDATTFHYVFASTDGTAAGTTTLTSPAPNIRNCLGCETGVRANAGSVYYFRRTYLPGGDYEDALRRTDGTNAGTVLLGSVTQTNDSAPGFVALGADLYFVPWGPSLYRVDDVSSSVKLVHDLEDPAILRDAASCNGKLFLSMSGGGGLSGPKLWVSDGTTAGTKAIYESTSDSKFLSCVGTRLYFADLKARWTDGTTVGAPLSDAVVDGPFWKAPNGSAVLFYAGGNLMKTDGTPQGTSVVRGFAFAYPIGAVADAVLFVANDLAASPRSIWRSDGTVNGTYTLTEGDATKVVMQGGEAYFYTDVYARGRELWSTDGTTAGTKMAAELHYATKGGDLALAVSDADHPISLGGEIYYVAKDPTLGTGIVNLGLVPSSSLPDGGPSKPSGSSGSGAAGPSSGDNGEDGAPAANGGAGTGATSNEATATADGCAVRATTSAPSRSTSTLFATVFVGASLLRRRRRDAA